MRKLILIALLTVFNAHAGGGGGGGGSIVFDPTNFGKNTITAAESIKSSAQQAAAYSMQLQQYQTQLMQLKSINPGATGSLMQQTIQDIRTANQYRGALENLYGSVNNVNGMYESRVRDMSSTGLSWDQYMNREKMISQRTGAGQSALLSKEVGAMQKASTDYAYAQSLQSQIPQSAGMHESMQMLNMQMNKMLMQQASLLDYLAHKGAVASDKASQELGDANRSANALNQIEQAEAKKRAEDAALLKAMQDSAKNTQRHQVTY